MDIELKRPTWAPATQSLGTSFSCCKCSKINQLSDGQQLNQGDIGDGVVQDTSGDVIFKVKFRAISCIPEEGEVLDGEVTEVNGTGI